MVKTLVEAIILVFTVMYLFLQNFRATLIPTIAVPVVLLGTFAVLAAFGFSINTLTMFGMVLAISLLVDDAIVVVENVERVMTEEGLPPKKRRANPWARFRAHWWVSRWYCRRYLFDGLLWRLNRGNLSSVLYHHRIGDGAVGAGRADPDACAVRDDAQTRRQRRSWRKEKGFFGWFNRLFDKSTHHYTDSVGNILRSTGRYLLLYLIIVVGMQTSVRSSAKLFLAG